MPKWLTLTLLLLLMAMAMMMMMMIGVCEAPLLPQPAQLWFYTERKNSIGTIGPNILILRHQIISILIGEFLQGLYGNY